MDQVTALGRQPQSQPKELLREPDWIRGLEVETLKPAIRNPGHIFFAAFVRAGSGANLDALQTCRYPFDGDRRAAAPIKIVIHHANTHASSSHTSFALS